MARAATTADVFNAIAERHRRDILDHLRTGEKSVGTLVDRLGLTQPQVSKHLTVLRQVGLVHARCAGRQRLYRLHGPALAPLADWIDGYRRAINERFDRLEDYLQQAQWPNSLEES